jgi:hypothetical protein
VHKTAYLLGLAVAHFQKPLPAPPIVARLIEDPEPEPKQLALPPPEEPTIRVINVTSPMPTHLFSSLSPDSGKRFRARCPCGAMLSLPIEAAGKHAICRVCNTVRKVPPLRRIESEKRRAQ